MNVNLFTFLALEFCGVAIALRQSMLDPKNRTFPCAPLGVRIAMFFAVATVCGVGLLFLRHSQPYAGSAASPVAVLAFVMAFYNAIMAWNVMASRLSPKGWRIIRRAEDRARRTTSPPRSVAMEAILGAGAVAPTDYRAEGS